MDGEPCGTCLFLMVLVLPTGRADYFGTVSNLAARVAGLAAPGQILVEGREAFRRERDWRRQNDAILLLPDPMGGVKGMPGGNTAIELEQIGYYLLKVGRRYLQTAPRYVLFVLRPNAIYSNKNSRLHCLLCERQQRSSCVHYGRQRA